MRNLWFILIGIFAVFALFFVMFTDWSFDSLIKKSSGKVQHNTTDIIAITTPDNTGNIPNYPNEIKNNTERTPQEELPEDEQLYKEEISEAYPKKVEIITIKKPSVRVSILSIDGATKVKMKIKAREKNDGIVQAKVGISHDMLTYAQAKKKGREVNFITHITGVVGKRVVYDTSISQFLSKNPLFKFSFKGKRGEKLTIIYQELKGGTFYGSKKIK